MKLRWRQHRQRQAQNDDFGCFATVLMQMTHPHLNFLFRLLPRLHNVTHINRRNKNSATAVPHVSTVETLTLKVYVLRTGNVRTCSRIRRQEIRTRPRLQLVRETIFA